MIRILAIFFLFPCVVVAANTNSNLIPEDQAVVSEIESTQAQVTEEDKRHRAGLQQLFLINQQVRETARQQQKINRKIAAQEAKVRVVAQDVATLETVKDHQREILDRRLRQLYQQRHDNRLKWFFSATTPGDLDRNKRFLRMMVDEDHRRLRQFVGHLNDLKKKRSELKQLVKGLAGLQSELGHQEAQLSLQLKEKAKWVAQIGEKKDQKISQLRNLKQQHKDLVVPMKLAFFEMRGQLSPPTSVRPAKEYGTFVHPVYRYRLLQKGNYYRLPSAASVHSIFSGKVAWAQQLAGYGFTVIVDHGDNYYSVYGLLQNLRVKMGDSIKEGETLGQAGAFSPIFGPGLYFEIRHFADAIDPRPWIKDSVIQTADATQN